MTEPTTHHDIEKFMSADVPEGHARFVARAIIGDDTHEVITRSDIPTAQWVVPVEDIKTFMSAAGLVAGDMHTAAAALMYKVTTTVAPTASPCELGEEQIGFVLNVGADDCAELCLALYENVLTFSKTDEFKGLQTLMGMFKSLEDE